MFKNYFTKLAVLFAVLLGSFFLFHGFYFAVEIKGPAIEKKFYTFNNTPFNDSIKLKLHLFNTGVNKVSTLLVGDINPWRPVPAFVIEHPKFGFIVFDSGLSSKIAKTGKKGLHPITRLLFDTHSIIGKDLPHQMAQDSLLPNKVVKVIFSHLHFDHIGNSDAFSKATYYVGQGTDMDNMTRMNGFEPDFIAK
ncbi:MAG: MBL fold metallo-hydrolase, partial [Chlorobi bacterium]|nr:MBL fold metallo-hydrolase [Chlorobiota bacterium]